MANINIGYKKFLAVGCSHGHLADNAALRTVLDFSARYKPDRRIHLGDYIDMAAFRTGAKGTPDEAAVIGDDLTSGMRFLTEFEPTDLLNGNHEDRLWERIYHPNAIVKCAANAVVNDIRSLAARLGCHHVDHYDITRSWIELGDTKFLHGFFFNENAIRDHSEHYGNCVIAHLHTVGSASGRRSDSPKAYCVGTLANIPAMHYALRRRATAKWSQGLAYGEFNDKDCVVWLAENKNGRWNLPL